MDKITENQFNAMSEQYIKLIEKKDHRIKELEELLDFADTQGVINKQTKININKELNKEEIINIPERIFLSLADEENYSNDFKEWEEEYTYWSDYRNSEKDIEFVSKEYAKKKAIALLGLDNAWPLHDVLDKLICASEILLYNKNYDGGDYEEINHSIEMAKKYKQQLYESEEFKKYLEQQNKEQ